MSAVGEARNGRGGPLDAMRFLAAAFIVLYHFGDDAPVALSTLSPVFASGWMATDFFLMLSGYVLARAYGARLATGAMGTPEFVRKRILKLWPAHAMMLALMAAMVVGARLTGASAGQSAAYDWGWFPAHLFWLQAWGIGAPPGWNMPTWSLSALVVCYALFPLLWRRLASASRLTAMTLGLLVLFASAAVAAAVHLRLADLPLQIGVLRAVPLFLFGAAIARLGPVIQAFAGVAQRAWLAAAAFVSGAVAVLEPSVGALLLIGTGIAVIGSIAPRRPWIWAEKAAALSFPFFVTHFVTGEIYYRLARVVGPRLPEFTAWPLWAGGFVFSLACALAFSRFVDRPVQARLNAWLDRKRSRALETAPAT